MAKSTTDEKIELKEKTGTNEKKEIKKTAWSKIKEAENDKQKKSVWRQMLEDVKIKGQRRQSRAASIHEADPFLKRLALNSGVNSNSPEGYGFYDICSKRFWVEGIIDPSKQFIYYWMAFVSMATTYNLVFIPLRATWHEEQVGMFPVWSGFDYTCDIIYLIDMFIQSRTAFLEQGLLVRKKTRLALNYIKSWAFWVDALSLLPTDFGYLQLGTGATYLRLNRGLKMYRLRHFFQIMETRSSFPNALRIGNLIFYIIILCHWNACIYYHLSRSVGFGSDEWVYPDITQKDYGTYTHKLCYSFFRSVLMLTTIGDEMVPQRVEEYVFVIANSLVGVLIFATIFGNVGGVIANMNADREEFQSKVDAVKQYMKIRAVGKDLEDRVLRWFDYTWINKESVDDSAAVSCLPDKLKAEISIRVHMNTLRRVAIFQDCEPGLLAELVLKLKLQVFSPGDFVCRKGDIGKEMYIVKRGRLEVVSEDGKKVFVTLTDGAVFGEVSTLNIAGNKTGNRRTASVRSVGYSDLFCLNKHDMWDALQEYPEAKKMLSEKGKQILRKDNLLDEEAARRDERRQQAFDQKIDNMLDMIMDLQADMSSLEKCVERLTSTSSSEKPKPEDT